MWVLKFIDGKGSCLFLREYFFDGRMLAFEFEEDALRFSQRIQSALMSALGVSLRVQKYVSDPKKEKMRKVAASGIDEFTQMILSFLK